MPRTADHPADTDAEISAAGDGAPSSAEVLPVTGNAVEVCALAQLESAMAVAARVDGVQIALVRLPDDTVYAVDHRDPRTGSCTVARGIVGSKQGEPTIATPLYKEVYSLVTGMCLSNPDYRLVTHPVEVVDGRVYVTARRPAPIAAE